MPQNIEIKVRVADVAALRVAVVASGARWEATQMQTDRYFAFDGEERVKLRTIDGGEAELIRYRRRENAPARLSDYERSPVRDAQARRCLVPKQEPIAVVRKRREIYLLDNVRFHLDIVDELGTFLELEAVVDSAHDEAMCRAQIDAIVRALGLDPRTFIRASYAELLP